FSKSMLLATISRASQRCVSVEPTGSNSPASMTRRSVACCSRPSVSISSSRRVPWPTAANLPILMRSAPVNAPLTWPKNSHSMRLAEMAIQLAHRGREPFGVLGPAQPARDIGVDAGKLRCGAAGIEEDDEGGPFLQDELLHERAGDQLIRRGNDAQEQQAVRIARQLF